MGANPSFKRDAAKAQRPLIQTLESRGPMVGISGKEHADHGDSKSRGGFYPENFFKQKASHLLQGGKFVATLEAAPKDADGE